MRGAEQPEQRAGAGDRLEAAPVATAAQRAVGLGMDVADLPCNPRLAAIELASEDKPGADARRHLDVGEVVESFPGPEQELGECTQVASLSRWTAMPILSASSVSASSPRHTALRQRLFDELRGEVQCRRGIPVDVDRRAPLGEDGQEEVGDGDVDIAVVERDADHRTDRGIEP
jgi:hypothetical protein